MKKRYVQVGVGGRARFFYEAIASIYSQTSEIVGFCDISQARMDYANRIISETYGQEKVPVYNYTEFEKMLDELEPDCVIVTTVDHSNHDYIIRSMEEGCDVICEKPLTIDERKAQEILDVQKKTGKSLRVTCNYRYAPHNTKIKELIHNGVIGEVFSIHFEWLLDMKHGADYFRKGHLNKYNSGGLLVHKSTHHFDLVNFWLSSRPKTVFAFGDLNFYGMQNAEKQGIDECYSQSFENQIAEKEPFSIDLESDDLSIEDTLGVTVKYDSGTILTYSLNAYMPWEGFTISLNGSKGRIEMKVVEKSYLDARTEQEDESTLVKQVIKVYPILAEPYEIELEGVRGGHGGGDPLLLDDLFGIASFDEWNRAATHIDGVMSILTGIAANRSIASGQAIHVKELLQ